jgi:hypothetical protein
MLMQIDPGMTYEEAYREVLIAINLGKLKVAGYLQPPHGS